ncbi:polysaccharide deacetylase family protein [Candidatus Margulisiibacteriota bacterium]
MSLCLSGYKINKREGIYITIDMCQSSKPYEKRLFSYLEDLGLKQEKPVPIAVCVAGKWIRGHQRALEEIRNMYLDITWVNHSYSHPIDKDFLNNPDVDFEYEVKENLKLMKKYGLKPSKYFRFPGLRHNKKRLKQLKEMGYINLDADAWLGKGEEIKDGSVILIHGNGNEVAGVVDGFIAYLSTRSVKCSVLSNRRRDGEESALK